MLNGRPSLPALLLVPFEELFEQALLLGRIVRACARRRARNWAGSTLRVATATALSSLSCKGLKRSQPGTLAARFTSFHFSW